MSIKLPLILLTLITISLSSPSQFIDFTYTKLLMESKSGGSDMKSISILPDNQKYQKYQFPSVCELKKLLHQGTENSTSVDSLLNLDDQLEQLRAKILLLLRLAEQIKISENYLKEIHHYIDLSDHSTNLSIFTSDLSSLRSKENQLNKLREQIDALTNELQTKIGQYNNSPRNQQFNIANYNYKIQELSSKIKYLQEQRQKAKYKTKSANRIDYDSFFDELSLKMSKSNESILILDRYLVNRTELYYLKSKAQSLRGNIQVDRLSLQQKKSCELQKQRIKSTGSSSEDIIKTLDELRQKKKEFGNQTTKYCEGVAKKLQDQIKKRMKAINWIYYCADGIDGIKQRLQRQESEYDRTMEKINQFKNDSFDDHHDNYNKTRRSISQTYEQMNQFKINQYVHDVDHLDTLIKQAELEKAKLEEKLKNMPVQRNGQGSFEEVRSLAEKIKRAKAKFCNQYEKYQREKRQIWIRVYQFESNQRFSAKMREEYINQGQKLVQLSKQYRQVSQFVISRHLN